MKTLCHGGTEIITTPEIRKPNRTLDFGAGFYLYERGVIDKETLIRELKTYRLVDQYLFHTDDALQYLHFQSATPIQL